MSRAVIGVDPASGGLVFADTDRDGVVTYDVAAPSTNTPERHNHMSTTDTLTDEQKQRVQALGVARDILGPTAGIFTGRPEVARHPDVITDLLELSEYILKGHELVHYQIDDGSGVAVTAVDVIPLPEAGEPGHLERIARTNATSGPRRSTFFEWLTGSTQGADQ